MPWWAAWWTDRQTNTLTWLSLFYFVWGVNHSCPISPGITVLSSRDPWFVIHPLFKELLWLLTPPPCRTSHKHLQLFAWEREPFVPFSSEGICLIPNSSSLSLSWFSLHLVFHSLLATLSLVSQRENAFGWYHLPRFLSHFVFRPVSLCSIGWPAAHAPPASASWVLRLQACPIGSLPAPGLFVFYCVLFCFSLLLNVTCPGVDGFGVSFYIVSWQLAPKLSGSVVWRFSLTLKNSQPLLLFSIPSTICPTVT